MIQAIAMSKPPKELLRFPSPCPYCQQGWFRTFEGYHLEPMPAASGKCVLTVRLFGWRIRITDERDFIPMRVKCVRHDTSNS